MVDDEGLFRWRVEGWDVIKLLMIVKEGWDCFDLLKVVVNEGIVVGFL